MFFQKEDNFGTGDRKSAVVQAPILLKLKFSLYWRLNEGKVKSYGSKFHGELKFND